MKKLRTNLRRVFVIAVLLLSKPSLYPLIVGAGLVVIGQVIHFISAGYLVKKDSLTTGGPYRFVRNPFYVGNILYDSGLCLMANNIYIALVYLPIFYLVVIPRRIRKEERFLSGKFGPDYLTYCRKAPRIIPRLIPAKSDEINGQFSWRQIIKHRELWRVMRALGLIVIFYLQFNIRFNLTDKTTQWHLLYNPLNIIALGILLFIIFIPPLIQYGVIKKRI